MGQPSASISFLDRIDQPLWASPEARALRRLLASAYGPRPGSKVEVLLDGARVDKLEINWSSPDLSVNELWKRVMEVARAAGRLRALVAEVLGDESIAGFHEAIAELTAAADTDAAPTRTSRAASAELPADYAQLRDILRAGGLAAELPPELTARVLAIAPATQDLTAYRLARVAWWRRPQLDQDLDRRFTRLTLVMDQGEKTQGQRWQAGAERYTDLREVLAAVDGRHPALVLLGEPGAGKTTLLRRLELDLAMAALSETLPEETAAPVTFYQPLSDFRERGEGMPPRAWLAKRWADAWPRLPGLEALLTAGRPVLLLLDALNEMPHGGQADYEARLRDWRTDLLRWTRERPALRLLFSCRSLDYSAPLSCDDLPVPQVQINRLADEQIEDFLAHYLPRQAEAVWRQLAEDERQVDLFRTPYYLRLLTQQVGQDGAIPPGRAALFTGFVRQALRRELGRGKKLFTEGDLLSDRDRKRAVSDLPWPHPHTLPEGGPLLGGLAQLAYGMQHRGAGSEDSQIKVDWQEALGLLGVPRDDLLEAGAALGVLEPDELRESVKFSHQLLQEYFAARRLAQAPDVGLVRSPWRVGEVPESLADTIARLADSEPLPPLPATGWEETSLLAAEMLPARQTADYVRELVAANLPLAGRAVASAALDLPEALRDEICQALVDRTQDEHADLRARIAAGLALGSAGDPRFEQRMGPLGAYLMPPLITIPAGAYPIGSDAPDAYTDESPAHDVTLPAYRIARFPVTNAEYACFVEAGGYDEERWWETEDARAWRRGQEASVAESRRNDYEFYSSIPKDDSGFDRWCSYDSPITTEQRKNLDRIRKLSSDRLREVIVGWYPADKHEFPASWTDSAFNNPAQPVVGVCWYEGRAYCAWLSAQCGLTVTLPAEPEWEAAARGLEGRVYSFGAAFDSANANTFESHIRRTTPVGVYPSGQTPEGVSDLCGNVWEWTRSLWGRTGTDLDFPYPYVASDGRENALASFGAARVVRGGSWFFGHHLARASHRPRYLPNLRDSNLGFRLVISSPISPEPLAAGAA